MARSLWGSVVPRFDEALSPEFYRLSGKIRAIAVLILAGTSFLYSVRLTAHDVDLDAWHRHELIVGPMWAVDIALGLVIWRARMGVGALRALTYVCLVLEIFSLVLSMQVVGTVNSHLLVFAAMTAVVYRLFFDFTMGAFAMGLLLASIWTAVIGETQHWLTPQPALPNGLVDLMYQESKRELGAATMQTSVLVMMFLLTNWAVARLRHRERALRLLREELYARDAGRVGRHTGRVLREVYEVGALIGAGGMGEIYEGHDRARREAVAIKLLHPHLVEDEPALRRFAREAEITSKLGSPNIVAVRAVDQDDGQPFLVLELLRGESLAQRIATRGALAPDEAADLAAQLAEGLTVAHAAGVVHRDLKPDNVFLCRDGTVKILDFGVSKIRDGRTVLTREAALIGTPDFMSPEQAGAHAGDVDARSDVFALGAILYYALSARRPFEADALPSILRRLCDEEPTPIAQLRPELPAAVAPVLAIAMAKRVDERYADARELARDLRAALDGTLSASVAARAAEVHRGRVAHLVVSAGRDVSGEAKTVDA